MKPLATSAFQFRLSAPEIFILLLGVLGLIAVELGFLYSRPDGNDYWLSLTGLTILLSFPLLRACATRTLDPLAPVYIVAAAYFLYFVYAPGSNLITGDEYFFGKLITPLVPIGSLYAAVGILALWIGYYAPKIGRTLAHAMPQPPASRDGAVTHAILIGVSALALFGVYLQASHISWLRLLSLGQVEEAAGWSGGLSGNENAFLNYFYSTVDWFTVAFMMLFAFSRRRRRWLAPIFVCLLLAYTTIGFRYRILILLGAPAVYLWLKHRRRPSIATMAVVALICVAMIGVIGHLRTAFRSSAEVSVSDVSASAAGATFARSLNIYQPYLAIIDGIPSRSPFLWGSSFAYLLVHPIPRSVWPDKPEAPIATITRVTLGSEAAKAGVAYPNIGEFYANFGVLGIFVGMWLFGVALRGLYEYLKIHQDNEWARVLYAIALPFLVQVVSRGYFVQIMQEACFVFVPLVGSMWVIARRSRKGRKRLTHGPRDILTFDRVGQ